MLLEEAILELLRRTGFAVIDTPNGDPTLGDGPAGLVVRGRGTDHQIDAIGDFILAMPFSNPGRLIVEAKCYTSDKVGLEVIRNMNGVLRDLSEFFVPGDAVQKPRYHYHAAVFSATDFTADAQRYAYAHDIYVVPLARNAAFRPIIHAIREIGLQDHSENRASLWEPYGEIARYALRSGYVHEIDPVLYEPVVAAVAAAIATLGEAFLARTTSGFPLFLTPVSREAIEIATSAQSLHIRVRHDRSGWWLSSDWEEREVPLFTFDMPEELFDIYYPNEVPYARSASTLKRARIRRTCRISSGERPPPDDCNGA